MVIVGIYRIDTTIASNPNHIVGVDRDAIDGALQERKYLLIVVEISLDIYTIVTSNSAISSDPYVAQLITTDIRDDIGWETIGVGDNVEVGEGYCTHKLERKNIENSD